MASRSKITIESNSLLVIRGSRSLRAWCPRCAAEVEMIPLNEVGVISNLPSQEVEAWISSEDLHHSSAADGTNLICLDSMLKHVRKATTISCETGKY